MKHTFDYREICYIHYNYALKNFDYSNVHNLIFCFFAFFIRTIGYLLKSPRTYMKTEELLVLIPSANNKRSTLPILDAMQNKNYTCVERFYNFLPMGRIYLKSIFHPMDFWKLYKSSPDQEKKMILAHFNDFAAAEELYKAVGVFYDLNPQIKLLIVSNDHFPIVRAFILQAREHGIKTAYTQHASVSNFFPPLVFDYSFLDGEESYQKYRSISKIEGKVFLVGSPRFDVISQLKRQYSDLIGVAFNRLDDNKKIVSLIKKLKENGFQNIVVRPHPQQDKNNPDWSMFTDIGCEVSHPLQENPFMFISRLSFLVAGTSSIHLEAALLRIPSVIYNMQTNIGNLDLDYYGYAKMGLTPIASSAEEIVSHIRNNHLPNIDTIRYYDAAYGTEYDGKSATLAAKVIDAYVDGKENEMLATLFEKASEGYYFIRK